MSSEIAGHFVSASKCVYSILQGMILIVLYTITYRALWNKDIANILGFTPSTSFFNEESAIGLIINSLR